MHSGHLKIHFVSNPSVFRVITETDSERPLAEMVVRYARNTGVHIPDHTRFESVTGGGVRCKMDEQSTRREHPLLD